MESIIPSLCGADADWPPSRAEECFANSFSVPAKAAIRSNALLGIPGRRPHSEGLQPIVSPTVMTTVKRIGHRAYLDGLRALAALWVVLSHLLIGEFGMNAHGGLIGLATNWALYSHLAVDVFIVLSGFCLILPVAQSGGTLKGGAWAFFGRRARRILPPFYAALALSVLVWLSLQAMDHRPFHVPPLAFLANVFLLQDIFMPLNIFNGPFWSIAVEWRIYFLFPLMVWGAARWGWAAVLLGSALLGGGLTLAMFRWHPEMILTCPWYLLLFALGAWAGFHSEAGKGRFSRQGVWVVLASLSALCLAWLLVAHPITMQGGADFGRYMPTIDTAAGLLTASALFLVSRAAAPVPLLSWHPLAALGTFAYSLYLTHMPALTLLRHLLDAWLPMGTPPLEKVGLTALTLPLIIGLAYLFFLAFERPFLRRRPASQAERAVVQEISLSGANTLSQ